METKEKDIKVVVIGGGTGSVAVLTGLKNFKDLDLKVIVCMTDDGGSNRVVRDEFGLLPLSDLRKSIIALAGRGNGIFRQLFTYRFDKGEGLSGHTLGNLIMMALSDITGSEKEAIKAASDIFNSEGEIIPVTYDMSKLCAKYENGKEIIGEHEIDAPEEEIKSRIENLYLEPKAKANPEAAAAIKNADFIVVGPGDLYTSLLSNIIVEGISEAIQASKGKIIYINNLMTENGETRGMKASDLIDEVEKYAGRKPDYVYLNNGDYPADVLKKYKESGEQPIPDDLKNEENFKVIRDDLISEQEVEKVKGDKLDRSLIRHDSKKLGWALYKLMKG